jgi:hypothetical protein
MTAQAVSDPAIRPLSLEELNLVSGGEITVVAEKGYVGIEISIGGYGIAVWATEGSICGQVKTPHGIHSGCTP